MTDNYMNEENQINKINETNESEQIKELLEKNLKLTEEIYAMTKKMKSHMAFQRVVSWFYLFIIIAPIILGLIYLPPLLSGLFDQYKDVLNFQAGSGGTIQGLLNGGTGGLNADTIKSLLNK
jgi:hypothetical protein